MLGVRRGFGRAARGLATAAWLAVLAALALPATAQADVLVSNLGQTHVGSSELGNGNLVGQTFSIATSNDNYTLSSIEISFRINGIASTDMGSLTVAIWSTHASGTNAGHPKSPLYMLTNPASVATPASLEVETQATFGAPANATLRAGRTYAVVVVYSKTFADLADAPFWTRTGADDDADPATGWSIVDARHASAAGSSTWDEHSGEAHKIRVNGTVVPGEVLVSNFGQTLSSGTSALRNGDRLGQTFSIATTGEDNYYTLSSIEIPLNVSGISSTDMGSLTVGIWSTHASGTNAGYPKRPLYTLTNPASITANTTVTFDAPVNSTLRAGRTYAVVVVYSKNIDTADIADAARWPNVGTGDDADAAPGWSIVDAWHASAGASASWSETPGEVRVIRVNGTAIQADALVSNLGQTSSSSSALHNGNRVGQTFSIATGSGNYAPSSIEIPFRLNGIASTDMGSLTVAIWSTHASGTNAGHPDSSLYTLTNPASITADTTATFDAPADSTLRAGRTYAVVGVYTKSVAAVDAPAWRTAGTGDDADPAPGWSIVDSWHIRAAGSASWSETTGGAQQIRVNGNAAINNAPEFSVDPAAFTLPENSAADTVVGTVTATDADSDVLTYSLQGTNAAAFEIDSGTGEIKTVSTATYNYESKKTYSVTVRADDGTDSVTVDVAIALTDELEKSAKPAAPTVTAKPATTDSLNVRWTKPGLNGGPDITGYEVEYREGGGNWTDAYDGSALSTIISGLSADTEYEVQVRANNGETPSDWSDSTEATTNAEVITPTCTLTAGDLWCGVVTVDIVGIEFIFADGFVDATDIGALSDNEFDTYTIQRVVVGRGGQLVLGLTSALTTTDEAELVLHVDGSSRSFALSDALGPSDTFNYQWLNSGLDWSSEPFVTLRLQRASTLLSGIAVNGTDIPGFLAEDDAPQHGVSAATTAAAIVATAQSASATVSYSGTDADISTADVHDMTLSDGANTVTITVTDQGESETYDLGVNRAVTADYGWKADSDFDTLKRAGNKDPRGIWSDDAATVYVSDYGDDKVYAYNTDGTRDSGKDFAVGEYPNGIWSDGTTLWVADSDMDKLLAYTLGTGAADAGEDFDTLDAAGNDDPRGVFSDGTTMWVSDDEDKKLYAYKMSDGTRDSGEDFDALDAAGNDDPRDIWSDGTTMWVADNTDKKLYAYKMSDKSHDSDKDFDTLDDADNDAADNDDPRGLWSHGSVLWTTDSEDDKLYAYNLPATMTPTNNAPVFPSSDTTLSVPENSAPDTVLADSAAALTATDADAGDTLTYTLEGTDADSFAHDSVTGGLKTVAGVTYNYEAAQNSYSVTVTVSDGTDSDTIAVTIDVADVNEKPDKPDKPTLAAVPDSTTSLTASWTKPGLNGGPDITDYDVRYREGTSGGWTDVTHNGDGRTRTLAGLAADTAYQAQVRADNGELESDWSDPSDAVRTNAEEVVATVPDAPRDLTATANGEARIDLDWRAPADDGGSAITGYRIEVSADGGSFFEALATTGAAVTRYAHTGLSAGTTRHYQAYAVNAEGESPASSVVSATTEEERQPEGNEPSVIRTYWIGSGGSNDKSGCAGTEEFRAYWNPPLDRIRDGVRTYKVADAWEADLTLRGGASDLGYTIQDTGGNPEHPELTGSVRIDGNGWLSMRVRGRFGADGWGGWSPTSSLYCWAASARADGPLLALTWPTPRDDFAAPDGGDFAVRADGAVVAVTGAALVGRHALLTLGTPALPGQSVSVDYLGSAMHPLADADGVPVPAWTDLPAENRTGAPEDAQWAPVVALAAAPRTVAPGLLALLDPGMDLASLSLAGIGLADADLAALWSPGGLRLDLRDAPGDPSALAALRRLDLSGNNLTDVSPLVGLDGLASLDLSGNGLSDIAPLSSLTALRRLDLRGNRIADLAPLASLPRLEVLLLDGNRIAVVGALTHLGTLEHLGLSENAVMDLAPLSDLWSLRRLDLGGNPAADLSPLGDLETLEWLRVPAANGVPAHRLIRVRWLWTGRSGVCLGCGDGMR